MARLFRTKVRKRTLRVALGATSLGVAAAMMGAFASSGAAFADNTTYLPGQSGAGSYTVTSGAQGLYINLGGTQLTGGTSQACAYYANDGATEAASAAAQGFLLSSQLTGDEAAATSGATTNLPSACDTTGKASSAVEGPNGDGLANVSGLTPTPGGGSNADVGGPSTPPDCKQGGGGGQSGVGVFVGLGCGYANTTVDSAGSNNGPDALGAANIAQVDVSLDGILSQVYNGGAAALCQGLQSGSALLGTACSQILTGIANSPTPPVPLVNPTVQVDVGNAYSQITSTSANGGGVAAVAHSNSIDVSVFPGLNSGLPPLLRVEVPAAIAVSCEGTITVTVGGDKYTCGQTPPSIACGTDTSSGWTNFYESDLIRISGTLIAALNTASSGGFPNPLEIGSCGQLSQLNSGLSQAEQAGLNQLLTLNLASATTSGTGVNGGALQVALLPGKAPGGGPVLTVNGSSISTTNGGAATTGTPPSSPASSPGAPQVPTSPSVASAESPTAVHTGEWWSGSLPLLAMLAALGGGLLAWPRLRKFPMVAHIVERVGH